MDQRQIDLVRTSFDSLPKDAEAVGMLFYAVLFKIDPELRPLFRGDMQRQSQLLVTMIASAVENLDRLELVLSAVRALGRRHAGYGVKETDYDTVEKALFDPVRHTPVNKIGALVLGRRSFMDVSGSEVFDLVGALTSLDLPACHIRKNQYIGLRGNERRARAKDQCHALRGSASLAKLRSTLRVSEVFYSEAANPSEYGVIRQVTLDHRCDLWCSFPTITGEEQMGWMQCVDESSQYLLFEHPWIDFNGDALGAA